MTPFVVGINFDANEAAIGTGVMATDTNEQVDFPGGIIGFKLNYWQLAC